MPPSAAISCVENVSVDSVGEWIPLTDAAVMLARSVRTLRWHAVKNWSSRGLAELRSPAGGKGKPIWWLHRSVDPSLSRRRAIATRDERQRASLTATYGLTRIERAYRKLRWLTAWRTACEAPRDVGCTERSIAHDIVEKAKREEGPSFPISIRSLSVWRAAYDRLTDDGRRIGVEGLIDRYNGPCSAGDEPDAPRSDAAIEAFYALYRAENRLSIRACHEVIVRDARRNGWSWSPGYAATAAWLRKTDDRSTTYLMRHGVSKWTKRYMPYLETDWTSVQPGEFYVSDHANCDFWVKYRDRQIRPWFTAIQDCRSRSIVGWHLGPAPHQDAILTSLRMAFQQRAIPSIMRIDNGKDFTSKLLTGITKRERDRLRREYGRDWSKVIRRDKHLATCDDPRWLGIIGELGIELIYAIPYSPWSKGTLERFFGTFHDQHGKTYATYCGNSAVTRPECLADIRRGYTRDQRRALQRKHGKRDWMRHAVLKFVDTADIPTLDEARGRIADYLDIYHAAPHRGQGMMGRSPNQVWATAVRLRRAADDELLFMMTMRGHYRVGGNGVRLTVGGAQLSYGARSHALRRWVGREVLIALDPDELSRCWALDPAKRTLIDGLDANEPVPAHATSDEAREVVAQQQRDRKTQRKAARTSARRMRTSAQRLAAHHHAVAAEVRATGTHDVAATIVPISTGFDKAAQASGKPRKPRKTKIKAAAVLTYGVRGNVERSDTDQRNRSTLDILSSRIRMTNDACDASHDRDSGMDAESQPDILSLVAGDRHG